MDQSTKLKILLSIYNGNKTYRDIGEDQGLSPKTLQKCMPYLAKEGLIKIDDKGWKKGKSKRSIITEAGLDWVIKNSMIDFLKVFSSVLEGVKKTEKRDEYQKIRQKKYSTTIDLFRNYLIEGYEKGLNPFDELKKLSELEYNKKFRINDLDQILRDALRKLSILIMFYWSDKSWEEIEKLTDTHYHVFSPRMHHWFSYRAGSNAKIDLYFSKIWSEFNHVNFKKENLEKGVPNNENK